MAPRGSVTDVNDEDPDRDAILARRRRLVALALAGLSTAAPGCYESHERAGDGGGIVDARRADRGDPMPCLGTPAEDAGEPTVCLSVAPIDAGTPTPCLDVAPEAAGPAAEPTPCLSFAERAGEDDGEDRA